jgi:hypothetical protein
MNGEQNGRQKNPENRFVSGFGILGDLEIWERFGQLSKKL